MYKTNPASMLYWWPKVRDLDIPKPKTIIVEIPHEVFVDLLDGGLEIKTYHPALFAAAEELGYPLFMRTDILSAKHQWLKTCYVKDEGCLRLNIGGLTEMNFMVMAPGPSALVLREYIELESSFTSHNGMPVAKERRYFVRDGWIECYHPYWPEESVRRPSRPDWRKLLSMANAQGPDEIELLCGYVEQVGAVMDGFWSVDFAKARDGRWLLIDMAPGAQSYHWSTCQFCLD